MLCRKSISILILLFASTQSQSTVLSPDAVSCPDVEVTFSCQTPQESSVLTWRITLVSNRTVLMNQPLEKIYFMSDQPGSSTMMSGSFLFHFTLVETSPALRSTMRTSLPLSLNTTMVECQPNTLVEGLTSDISSFLFVGVFQFILVSGMMSSYCNNPYRLIFMQFPLDLEG